MKTTCISLSIISSLCLLFTACSKGDNQNLQKLPPPPTIQHATPEPVNPGYCPHLDQLVKNDLYWGSADGWQTHTPSFATQLTEFLGAQWQGLNDGKILCIYQGNQGDFSVTLQTNQFTAIPWGGAWEGLSTVDDGTLQARYVINCVSTSPLDCPFPTQAEVWQNNSTNLINQPNSNVTPLSN